MIDPLCNYVFTEIYLYRTLPWIITRAFWRSVVDRARPRIRLIIYISDTRGAGPAGASYD